MSPTIHIRKETEVLLTEVRALEYKRIPRYGIQTPNKIISELLKEYLKQNSDYYTMEKKQPKAGKVYE